MTIRDDVHKALDEHAARSHGDICDDTGLESVQVTNALNQLKNLGQAKRTAEGWIRVASNASAAPVAPAKGPDAAKAGRKAPAPVPTLSASTEREREAIADAPTETKLPAPLPAAPTQAAAPAKRRHKKKPAKKEKPVREANGARRITAINGALSFSLTEGCEIAIERKDGNGERAFLSKSDALRLADFIQLVRPALVDA